LHRIKSIRMIRHIFKVCFLLLIFINFSFTDNENVVIPQLIKEGKASEISNYFNSNIELIIIDKANIYSKKQAELILAEFFKKNKPTNFKKLHEGGKDSSKFVIGELSTLTGNYRVYILFKQIDKNYIIFQFRIDHENN
jgi:hypothetical protein